VWGLVRVSVLRNRFSRIFKLTQLLALSGTLGIILLPSLNGELIASAQPTKGLHLSDNVIKQIKALQKEKASHTKNQQKIDSQLFHAFKKKRGLPMEKDVPDLETAVEISTTGTVVVDINANVTDSLLGQIKGAGGTILSSTPKNHSVRVSLPIAQMESIAGLPDVKAIEPEAQARNDRGSTNPSTALIEQKLNLFLPLSPLPPSPFVKPQHFSHQRTLQLRAKLRNLLAGLPSAQTSGFPSTGVAFTEGDVVHRADLARNTFGANGTGIKVGILSDSFNLLGGAAANITAGDLPAAGVTVLQDSSSGNDEGRAIAQIIHDLAPNAQLYFATAFGGPANFAQNIRNLRAVGCDIIVDDVGYFNESPFQDGIIAQAVNDVTASGALYFSSAGNQGNFDYGTSSTWEGDFVDGGTVGVPGPTTIPSSGTFHDFGGTIFNTVAIGGGGRRLDLFWSDPLGASSNDYDVYVLDPTGANVVAASTNIQSGFQNPYEAINSIFPGQQLVIVKYAGDNRFLHMDIGRGVLTISTPGQIRGHAAAVNAFSVAAVDAANAYPSPFSAGPANPIENFSSDGPRRIFYNADGSAITPSDFSSSGGTVRQKPDIAAADCISTSVTPTFLTFCGTSAAAPHAAAIAALIKSYQPSLTPTQVRSLLTSTALDIEDSGVDRNSGYGIVDAFSALQAVTTISGLSPASGPVGSSVVITGANFTGATTVKFNGVAASFTINSPTQITATVPAGAITGTIVVTAPNGTATSPSAFTVTAAVAPTISDFTPVTGPVGTSVVITGTNFTGTTVVSFNGIPATSFTVNSPTQITATVPAGATTGSIAVTTPNGTVSSVGLFTLTVPAPTVTGFSPNSGPVGTSVVIAGTNFTGTTALNFNGTAASFVVNSDTQISATVPVGASTGAIAVTSPNGTATSVGLFTVTIPTPTLSGFSPANGPVGTSVVITGTNFTGATAVQFNGQAATFTVNSATQITATVPNGATNGPISVTTPDGTAISSTNFTVTIPAPSVASFSPSSGPVGTSVVINGTNFTGATVVKFNGLAATFTVNSDTQITTTVPIGAATGSISVVTSSGTATSTGSFSVAVTYSFTGFFQPVANPPFINTEKAGRAIPVKFSLGGNQGLNILAMGYPTVTPIQCPNDAPMNTITDADTVAATASSLIYDAANDQYIYVWKTDKTWKNSCRKLTIRLNDGTDHIALFKFVAN
jgi:Subtilase family